MVGKFRNYQTCLLLILTYIIQTAISKEGGLVIELDDKTFESRVIGSEEKSTKNNEAWFILFYANWCTHCHKLMPIWKSFAE